MVSVGVMVAGMGVWVGNAVAVGVGVFVALLGSVATGVVVGVGVQVAGSVEDGNSVAVAVGADTRAGARLEAITTLPITAMTITSMTAKTIRISFWVLVIAFIAHSLVEAGMALANWIRATLAVVADRALLHHTRRWRR
jgi:hypothetical protein